MSDKKPRTTTKTITKKVAAAVDADMAASILKLLGGNS